MSTFMKPVKNTVVFSKSPRLPLSVNGRKYAITIVLYCCALQLTAQNINRQMVNQLLNQLKYSKADESRINVLVELGKFHIFKAGEATIDLDSAVVYLQQAGRLSDSLHLVKWQHEVECMKIIGVMERGDSLEGRTRYNELINACRQTNDKETEAGTYIRMGIWLATSSNNYQEVLVLYQKALLLYRELKNQEKEIYALEEIANIHLNEGKLQQAENELQDVLKQYKAIHYPKLHYTYNLLSIVNRIKGDFDKGLDYSLRCIESMNQTKDTLTQAGFYGDLARMYFEVGDQEKSIEWYKLSLQKWRQEGRPNFSLFASAGYIAREMIAKGNAGEALGLIDKLRKEIPPITIIQKASIAQTLAFCYESLQEYGLAEKYYNESLGWYAQTSLDFEMSQQIQQDVGKFYLARNDFKKAGVYLRKALAFYPQKIALATLKDLHFMLYRVDSAEKNYLSAIDHFREHKILNDSIFTIDKFKKINEIEIVNKTKERENNIKLLNKESAVQKSQLQLTFGGLIFLLIIIGLLYNRYRIKYKNNQQLQMQQREISDKNDVLQHLLEEKEWLLKEVHHRVKNNLHTVMSLLESQSIYLENDALRAIRDSQRRVYAMSLLHQKLYQADSVSSINMASYMPELVHYLRDSFEGKNQIRFNIDICPIVLDVSQAVPIGLILNEAVTNSLKYAFPGGGENNEIQVKMVQHTDKEIQLEICDNGIGLPEGFDSKRTSLGMTLMKGLTEDINGIFVIRSENGTRISIIFQPTDLHRQSDNTTPLNLIALSV